MNILDAKLEEQAVDNSINWRERELLAYPEDAPILQQLREHVPRDHRTFSGSEIENFLSYYAICGSKRKTCRKFDITKEELDRALRS